MLFRSISIKNEVDNADDAPNSNAYTPQKTWLKSYTKPPIQHYHPAWHGDAEQRIAKSTSSFNFICLYGCKKAYCRGFSAIGLNVRRLAFSLHNLTLLKIY